MSIYYKNHNFYPWKACYVEDNFVKQGYKFDNEEVFNESIKLLEYQNISPVLDAESGVVYMPCSDPGGPYPYSGPSISFKDLDNNLLENFNVTCKFKINIEQQGSYYTGFCFSYGRSAYPGTYKRFFVGHSSSLGGWQATFFKGDATLIGERKLFKRNSDDVYEINIAKSGNYQSFYFRIVTSGEDFYPVYENYYEGSVINFMRISCSSRNTVASGVSVELQEVVFNGSIPTLSQFFIGESGEKYIYAGPSQSFDKTGFSANGSGDIYVSIFESGVAETGAFTSPLKWNNYDEVGNYPYNNFSYEYLYQLVLMSGADSYFNAFSTSEIKAPYATSGIPAFKDNYLNTIDLFLRWENGFSQSDEVSYVGTNLAYYYDNDWHYEQSNGAFSTKEEFVNLNLIGESGERIVTTRENIPPEASQVRFTGWDEIGLKSARVDMEIQDIDTAFSEGGFGSLFTETGYSTNQSGILNINNGGNGVYVYNPIKE